MSEDTTQVEEIRPVPQGFTLKTVETEAAGVRYTVEILQADSLESIRAFYTGDGKNADEILRDQWNAAQEQGAKQSPKTPLRTAIEAKYETDEAREAAIAEAIEKAKATTRSFVIGAPRGGGGAKSPTGISLKKREALGAAVAAEYAITGAPPSAERMAEIYTELGIDPEAVRQALENATA